MLQRVQTIYFLLAFAATLCFLFLSLATINDELVIYANEALLNGKSLNTAHLPSWLYYILPLICVSFISFCITKYKNRPLQIKLCGASLLLSTVLAVLNFIQLDKLRLHEMPEGTITYGVGSYLPVMAIAFLILGYRGVKKDEDLIRSVDRLR
ncbi:MAG: hypothetical protein ACJAUV_001010 [Flavobacteriales bacterium]|jgi:hypothetical protein